MVRPDSPEQRPPARAAVTRVGLAAGGAAMLAALAALMLGIGGPKPPAPEQPLPAPAALTAALLPDVAADPEACRKALAEAGFVIEPAGDQQDGAGCGYQGAIWLKGSLHGYSEPLEASCAAVAAMAVWERDVLEPAARRHFGQRVDWIELAGPAYSCRAIAGREDGRMSEHARANAVDIKGFVLEDGREVGVAPGWRGAADEQAFLREVRDGACGVFQVVLSPDYNADHRDHLHVDMGRWKLCR